MATVRQYMGTLLTWQRFVARKMGTDLENAPVATRAVAAANAATLGVIVKALVDKGVITEAEIQTAATNATSDTGWVPEENV